MNFGHSLSVFGKRVGKQHDLPDMVPLVPGKEGDMIELQTIDVLPFIS